MAGQSESGVQAQGIGFAISINTIKPLADELVAAGTVVHPYIGIQYMPLTSAMAAQLGIPKTTGFVIGRVEQGSPADDAGLREGDIITKFDGQALESESSLAQAIDSREPGDTVELTVKRGDKESIVSVTLGEMPSTQGE